MYRICVYMYMYVYVYNIINNTVSFNATFAVDGFRLFGWFSFTDRVVINKSPVGLRSVT